MADTKQLYLSQTDKKLAGVCGGLAEYYNIDSTVVRLAWALVTVFSGGLGLIGYLVAMVIMPNKPQE